MIDNLQIVRLQNSLVKWYEADHRDLPWRHTLDPYRIWISEIMLQQTRVETVIPYYERFVNNFPSLQALAHAKEEDVIKLWEGLGYYSRARNLHKGAQIVLEAYQGILPSTYDELVQIPGIGDYTAGAILSIAYNQDIPAVDGNVLRVVSRWFAIDRDINNLPVRKHVRTLIAAVMPFGKARQFNQAVMELGALICVPKEPRCLQCPVIDACEAREKGLERILPIKGKPNPPREVERIIAVIWNGVDILMHRRPAKGLLGGLWEFPGWDVGKGNNSLDVLERGILTLNFTDFHLSPIGPAAHVFSHIKWQMMAYLCHTEDGNERGKDYRWVNPRALHEISIPTALITYKEWVKTHLV